MARSVFTTSPETVDPDREEPLAKRKPPLPRRKPIVKGGAASDKYIRAATQGGADRTYQEVLLDQIQDSAIRDRIDVNEDLDSLVESIRENGQQIPILVRVVNADRPYEIVVGRRRLAAMRRLGHSKIKAFVSKLDDREAFIAQGIENSARLETSFIERARAAAQGVAAGYEHKDVAHFLNISKTLMSFMTRIYEALGEPLVLRIGPARGIGRRKWEALLQAMDRHDISSDTAVDLVDMELTDSVERFETLLKSVQSGGRAKPPAVKTRAPSDKRTFLGGSVSTVRKPGELVVKTRQDIPAEILDRISHKIEEIVAEYGESLADSQASQEKESG